MRIARQVVILIDAVPRRTEHQIFGHRGVGVVLGGVPAFHKIGHWAIVQRNRKGPGPSGNRRRSAGRGSGTATPRMPNWKTSFTESGRPRRVVGGTSQERTEKHTDQT